jgi:hypothetical protein
MMTGNGLRRPQAQPGSQQKKQTEFPTLNGNGTLMRRQERIYHHTKKIHL